MKFHAGNNNRLIGIDMELQKGKNAALFIFDNLDCHHA